MISVVIPVYNDSEHIVRALDSVINQIYKDFEIVIVDDASTDKTPSIIKEYKEKHSSYKIKIITSKVNQGAGMSRIIGVQNSSGFCVTFLDSDDALRDTFLNNTLIYMYFYSADIVITSVALIYPKEKKQLDQIVSRDELFLQEEATVHIFLDDKLKFITGVLFKKKILKKIKMSPKRIGEDTSTLFYALYVAESVRLTKYCGYYHYYREGSLLTCKEMIYTFCNSAIVDHEICDFLLENKNEKLFEAFLQRTALCYNKAVQEIKTGFHPTPNYVTIYDIQRNVDLWNKYVSWYFDRKKYIDELGITLEKLDLDEF